MKDNKINIIICFYRVAGSGVCGGTGSWITTLCRYLSSGSACLATSTQPTSATTANLSSLKVCQSCLLPIKSVTVQTRRPHAEQTAQRVMSKLPWKSTLSLFLCFINVSQLLFPKSKAEASVELFKSVFYKQKMGSETQF